MSSGKNDEQSSRQHRPKSKRDAIQEEEDCQDRVCNDTKKDFNFWLKNMPKRIESQCPLDKDSLGRNTWSLLHTMAAKYPHVPSAEEKSNMSEFIKLMSILYPCSYCAKEFREDMKYLPPKLESRKDLALWFCQIHNKVNSRLNKPNFDCSKVDERWRTGPKDGSCL